MPPSTAATFYGRLCNAGEVCDLWAAQIGWLRRAMAFHLGAAPTINLNAGPAPSPSAA